jgi:hypothetical protein
LKVKETEITFFADITFNETFDCSVQIEVPESYPKEGIYKYSYLNVTKSTKSNSLKEIFIMLINGNFSNNVRT